MSRSPMRLTQYLNKTDDQRHQIKNFNYLLQNKKLNASHQHIKELQLLKDSGRCDQSSISSYGKDKKITDPDFEEEMKRVKQIWSELKVNIEKPQERQNFAFKKMIAKFKHINYKPSKEEIKIVKHPVSFINRNITAVSKKEEPRGQLIDSVCSEISEEEPQRVIIRRDKSLQQIAARKLFQVSQKRRQIKFPMQQEIPKENT